LNFMTYRMMCGNMDLSIILPVYNEGNRLAYCVERLESYLVKRYTLFEIIIVEDNSTDESYEVTRRISGKYKNIVLIRNSHRLGRGASLAIAIKKSSGNNVVYMDVDLATDIKYIELLVHGLDNGASITTGSRLLKGSRVKRPLMRSIASRSYNSLVRVLFLSNVHDHQCGFKGFNKKDVIKVIDLVQDNHWFWDTELLIICQNAGLKIFEFPVSWEHNGGNNLNSSKVKLFKDSVFMGTKLLKLKYRLIVQKSMYIAPRS